MKKCSRCGQEKPVDSFSKNSSKKDGLNSYCKSCQKVLKDKHYRDNKEKYKARTKKDKGELRRWINDEKSRPCADCGIRYPYWVMDFDHRESETKLDNISSMVSRRSVAAIKEEISKCDVVCANCHRQRTHERLPRSAIG